LPGLPNVTLDLTFRKQRYTSGTPNGQKISITLEELNLPYSVRKIEIAKNEQKEEWFLKINRKRVSPELFVALEEE
jgi:glutathione S-transferase